MRWAKFLRRLQAYKAVWQSLKAEFTGDIRNYLESSYLVIAYCFCGQMPFDLKEAYSIAVEHPDFFVNDKYSRHLLELAAEYKSVKEYEYERKRKILREMEKIDTASLSVVEFCVEIRFVTLKFDYIQEIKQSVYCDTKATDMSSVSIRPVLSEPL